MNASSLLNPVIVKKLAAKWIEEDIPNLDFNVIPNDKITFVISCKNDAILCGVPFLKAIFELCDIQYNFLANEGDQISKDSFVAFCTGSSHNLLKIERLCLNILSRSSGIATQAKRILTMIKKKYSNIRLAGTRKTTPGFRLVEKYSLLIAGVDTHRYDLSSLIMIKDNHIDLCGSISNACNYISRFKSFSDKIEIECRTKKEVIEALECSADIIMLDNWDPNKIKDTVEFIKQKKPETLVELSGGINESNIENYLHPLVDIISMSCLTQGYPCIDFSMKFLQITN